VTLRPAQSRVESFGCDVQPEGVKFISQASSSSSEIKNPTPIEPHLVHPAEFSFFSRL